MNEFENFNISQGIKQALAQLNYSVPTEVQKKSIPAILEERNVVCESHTGSGKTIAFSLPLIERVIQGKS
ncbi:MAG TPA: DEAD/DEAH box helicase, partial [archaeon]|nr:DEAD/DEAH box helicase [archaeon]